MDYETLLTVQGYAKFFLILAVFTIFYSYAYSIYKRDKKGERDFEKYFFTFVIIISFCLIFLSLCQLSNKPSELKIQSKLMRKEVRQ